MPPAGHDQLTSICNCARGTEKGDAALNTSPPLSGRVAQGRPSARTGLGATSIPNLGCPSNTGCVNTRCGNRNSNISLGARCAGTGHPTSSLRLEQDSNKTRTPGVEKTYFWQRVHSASSWDSGGCGHILRRFLFLGLWLPWARPADWRAGANLLVSPVYG